MLRKLSVSVVLLITCMSLQAEPVKSLRDGWTFTFRESETATPVVIHSVVVPMNWTFYHKAVSPLGIARYERMIDLGSLIQSPTMSRPPLMLRIGEIGTACSIYIDDKLVAQRGLVSPNAHHHVPMVAPLYLPLPVELPHQIRLTIDVSNFEDTNGGGIWGPIQLGPEASIRQIRDQSIIRDSLVKK
jgi:hypothetical protein